MFRTLGPLCLGLLVAAGVVMADGVTPLAAGEFNPVLNIGDAAPAWRELPDVDGRPHSLADLKEKRYVVVVFTCNSCPYSVDYEDRLIAFAKKYGGVDSDTALVAINVNQVAADLPPKMKERAEAKGFNFPYLYDATQQIARDYGATFTPEFFLLDAERKVLYMGAFDDHTKAADVQVNYIEAALAAARAGNPAEVKETPARGCLVRYARQRRAP